MIFRFSGLVVLTASLFFHSVGMAGVNKDIRIEIEEPAGGEAYSGISNLRGWAVAPRGVDRVEVFIDNAFAFEVPIGGSRGDVGRAFPSYPDSDLSGFSMAFNYKNLTLGDHKITIRAFDSWGDYNDRSVMFTSETFNSAFIPEETVEMRELQSIYVLNYRSLLFMGATLDGGSWDFVLSWDTPSQGFKVHAVGPAVVGSELRRGDVIKEYCQGTVEVIVRSDGGEGIYLEHDEDGCGANQATGGGITVGDPWGTGGDTSADDSSDGLNGPDDCDPDPKVLDITCKDPWGSDGDSSSNDNADSGQDDNAGGTSGGGQVANDSGSGNTTPPPTVSPPGEVFACVTSPESDFSSSAEVITLRNGLQFYNHETNSYRSGSDRVVFKARNGNWYQLKPNDDHIGGKRLDVIREPSSCWEYDYGTVRQTKMVGADKVLVSNWGEIKVRASCPILQGAKLGEDHEPGGFPQTALRKVYYYTDLLTGETCEALELTR